MREQSRNEIKNAEGPFVLIANHQSALDVVNIVIQYKGRLRIVFGNNYYYSMPKIIQKLTDACGFTQTMDNMGFLHCDNPETVMEWINTLKILHKA